MEMLGHEVVQYSDEKYEEVGVQRNSDPSASGMNQQTSDWHVNRKQFGHLHVVAKEELWNPRHQCRSKVYAQKT